MPNVKFRRVYNSDVLPTVAGLPDYWPWMVAYHRVRARLYCRIIQELDLSPTARVLDAGSGDNYYSQLFANLLGDRSQIVAVDCNPALLKAAGSLAPNVHRCLGDLECLGLAPASFDAVWLCRSMYSAPDPVARLAALVPLLRPGGKLVVVENDTAHYPILPWPADFEHRLRAARLQYENSRCADATGRERYKAASHLARWLAQLGLADLTVHTYVSEDLAPFDAAVETYWRLFMAWDANVLESFLSPADAAEYGSRFDPHSPSYLLSQPGCYCLELTTLASATRPHPS
jgi:SAM-dependent methyltransferase